MKEITQKNYTPIQLKLPLEIGYKIETTDSIYTFNEVMEHIDLRKYIVEEEHETGGRPKYDEVKLMKIVLFAFMESGYTSLREMEKLCKTDIRFMWILDGAEGPSYATISNFINKVLKGSIEEIFTDINNYIFEQEGVDLRHIYIDGSKIEANANKYSWV